MTIFRILLITGLSLVTACSNTPNKQLPGGSAQAGTQQSATEWHCEGGSDKQWQCRDLSKAHDNIEHTQPPHEAVAPLDISAVTVAETPKVVPTSKTQYADDSYVVQLIAARSPATIARFKQQHPQLVTKPLSIEKNGEAWLVLILGTYATYAEAQAAVAEITPPLINQPWIRPIAPLQPYLEAQL